MRGRELTATIAVVDDDPSMLRALARLMRTNGYTVRCYESASEFLRRPGTEKLDCLVADVQMPGLTGFELHAALEARGVHLPVVYMTAHDTPWAREQASMAHAVAFLAKPFHGEDLLTALELALDRPDRGDPPGPASVV
jgi:FixJ family two-component response regulator